MLATMMPRGGQLCGDKICTGGLRGVGEGQIFSAPDSENSSTTPGHIKNDPFEVIFPFLFSYWGDLAILVPFGPLFKIKCEWGQIGPKLQNSPNIEKGKRKK